MKLMIPFIPHLAHECLELHKCKTVETWPDVNEKDIFLNVKIAVQINGKTRDIVSVDKDIKEENLKEIVLKNSKAKKYLDNKKIIKIIFVKNKIINYIIKN